jgi:hypothetical protein
VSGRVDFSGGGAALGARVGGPRGRRRRRADARGWTAALQQKNGTDFGTFEGFFGSFDAIRDPDSIDAPD